MVLTPLSRDELQRFHLNWEHFLNDLVTLLGDFVTNLGAQGNNINLFEHRGAFCASGFENYKLFCTGFISLFFTNVYTPQFIAHLYISLIWFQK